MRPAQGALDRRRTILLSSAGEIVEGFDVMICLSLAPILAVVLFPSSDGRTSLFGRIGDHSGHKHALVQSRRAEGLARVLVGDLRQPTR